MSLQLGISSVIEKLRAAWVGQPAEVLRLRATSAVSRDQSVRRFAQDDDSVGVLTREPYGVCWPLGERLVLARFGLSFCLCFWLSFGLGHVWIHREIEGAATSRIVLWPRYGRHAD